MVSLDHHFRSAAPLLASHVVPDAVTLPPSHSAEYECQCHHPPDSWQPSPIRPHPVPDGRQGHLLHLTTVGQVQTVSSVSGGGDDAPHVRPPDDLPLMKIMMGAEFKFIPVGKHHNNCGLSEMNNNVCVRHDFNLDYSQ